MTGISLLLLCISVFALGEFLFGSWLWLKRRRIKHLRRAERTRTQFAHARNKLMSVLEAEKISVKSRTFQSLYGLQTFIMRSPNEYRQISAMLRRSLFREPGPPQIDTAFSDESLKWSPETTEVVRDTASAMIYLMVDYSFRIRIVGWLRYRLRFIHRLNGLLKGLQDWVAARRAQKDEIIASFRESRESMEKLCSV